MWGQDAEPGEILEAGCAQEGMETLEIGGVTVIVRPSSKLRGVNFHCCYMFNILQIYLKALVNELL